MKTRVDKDYEKRMHEMRTYSVADMIVLVAFEYAAVALVCFFVAVFGLLGQWGFGLFGVGCGVFMAYFMHLDMKVLDEKRGVR